MRDLTFPRKDILQLNRTTIKDFTQTRGHSSFRPKPFENNSRVSLVRNIAYIIIRDSAYIIIRD